MQRFVIGMAVWWLISVAGASLIWPSLWLNPKIMQHEIILGIPLMINGWHVLFHLLSAGIGLFVAACNLFPIAWAISTGALYLAIGIVVHSGQHVLGAVGMMPNDIVGNALHVAEGSLMLIVGAAALAYRWREENRDSGWPTVLKSPSRRIVGCKECHFIEVVPLRRGLLKAWRLRVFPSEGTS